MRLRPRSGVLGGILGRPLAPTSRMKSPLIGGSRGDGSVYSRRGSRHTNRASAFFDITEHSSDKGSTMFAAVVALSNT